MILGNGGFFIAFYQPSPGVQATRKLNSIIKIAGLT